MITNEWNINAEVIDAVLVIRFDRPEKKNALTISMYAQLNTLIEEARKSPDIRAVVFGSTSDSFTAGNDLKDFLHYATTEIDEEAPVFQFLHHIATFDKPLIAAVRGLAVGIGLTLLLHCDFVYVADDVKLMAPFVNLGLVPEFGSSKLLVELVGERQAAEILILGNVISGERAVEMGIANEMLSANEVESRALKTARILTTKPPEALRLSKELIRPKTEILRVMEKENEYIKRQLGSAEAIEAITAVLEKRKPNFQAN